MHALRMKSMHYTHINPLELTERQSLSVCRDFQSLARKYPHIMAPRHNSGYFVVAYSSMSGVIARALGYPYPRPGLSYLFSCRSGAHAEIQAWPAGSLPVPTHPNVLCEFLAANGAPHWVNDLTDRCPVLAYGSNASPEQLYRKFGSLVAVEPGDKLIPVFRGTLDDHDVVYSASLASYGSVPATLQQSLGTTCQVFVTMLTPLQLQVMHESEGFPHVYDFFRLKGRLTLDLIPRAVDWICSYQSELGCFNTGHGAPTALDAVPATNRRFGSMSQSDVQQILMERIGWPSSTHDFIKANVEDPAKRGHHRRAASQDTIQIVHHAESLRDQVPLVDPGWFNE